MSFHSIGQQQGPYWALLSNGTISENVYFPQAGTYRFEIVAKGDLAYWLGPKMELLVDGQSKGFVFVNHSSPEVYIFQAEISAGTHEVSIAYNNNTYNPEQGTDRNLYVDKITIVSTPGYFTTDLIEAEDMSYHSGGAQRDNYWLLWSNGFISEDVHFSSSGSYRIEITAKGDLTHLAGPEMQLLIDGQSKGIVFVNSTTPQVYIFHFEVSAGTHEVSIAYNNNYYDLTLGIDRNLYVDKIAISYQ
jgi:hypothetical protein